MNKTVLKTIYKALVLVFVCSISYFTICAGSENSSINKLVDDFKKDATFYQYSKNYSTNFYIVKSDNKDITPSFNIVDEYLYPGYEGDILTTLKNEVGVEPFTSLFSYYFGGHAALVVDNQILQTAGNAGSGKNHADYYPNDWLDNHTMRYKFIGLKVKTDYQTRVNAINKAKSWLYRKYNYSFIFNTHNSFYCTNYVSEAYNQANKDINLNKDDGIVSVQDLILSDKTYIFMYKEINPISYENRDANALGYYNLYFLDDGNNYNFDI